LLLSSWKYDLDVYPGYGFFSIPDPGVKKVLDPGSSTLKFSIPVPTPQILCQKEKILYSIKLPISPQKHA
jgi:hypothetical protein